MVARTGKAIIAGVMGNPIAHSMSPALHEFWLNKYNIDGAYIPMLVESYDLKKAINSLLVLGMKGCNLTLPHKEDAMDLMDYLDEQAQAIGAVNTVVVDDNGKLHGRNTDGYGFVCNLKQFAPRWNVTDGKTMIVGAGGAAKSVIAGLINAGCSDFVIVNRTKEKAEAIANQMLVNFRSKMFNLRIKVVDWKNRNNVCDNDISLLVNTTQLGMVGQPQLEIDISKLSKNAIVTDIVYNPLKTDLLYQAESMGVHVVDGLGMLLWQAQAGFEAWFGICPDVDDDLRQHICTIMNNK